MGSRSLRKKQFLTERPLCCFCGGKKPSQEIDHIPSRSIFNDRQWPEGFEFPACISCNRATRYDEQIVALVSRFYPDPNDQKHAAEFYRLCDEIYRYRPDIIEELRGSAARKKRAAKSYSIEPNEGEAFGSLPLVAIGPKVNGAVSNFARKLVLALYYKHSGKILEHGAGIAIRWFSNIEIASDFLPRELATFLKGYPDIIRCNTSLLDQFSYGYVFSECGKLSIFLCFFRKSFAIVGAVNLDSKKFDLPDIAEILGPFTHEESA